jgi:hypothetical protein
MTSVVPSSSSIGRLGDLADNLWWSGILKSEKFLPLSIKRGGVWLGPQSRETFAGGGARALAGAGA